MNQDIVDTLWAAIGALRTIVLEAPHDAEEAKSSAVASIEAAEAWLHEQERWMAHWLAQGGEE